jgi:hypothetical protein
MSEIIVWAAVAIADAPQKAGRLVMSLSDAIHGDLLGYW